MNKLGLDVLDLYLIHWPVEGKYKETWKALEKLYKDGRVRAIGVCNFHQHHLDDLLEEAEVVPMVNQIELHPKTDAGAFTRLLQGERDSCRSMVTIRQREASEPSCSSGYCEKT